MNKHSGGLRAIIGESAALKSMLSMIQKVSGSRTSVLITGESGTGKELVARMIHDSGAAADKPFIPVNCGAIPENLIESEMFGHKRGSFTGAVSDKMGLFEAANGGTLFLDEVGELPLGMQVKLLRALQERAFRKVGGTDDIRVDVRIIAATNRDLEAAIGKGTFREDLFYRLNVIMIKTPALRERKGDVELLARHFLKKFSKKFGKAVQDFDPPAMAALAAYSWPGNVRELENVVERAVALESSEKIGANSLPVAVGVARSAAPVSDSSVATAGAAVAEIRVPAPDFTRGSVNLDAILGEVEKAYLMKALEHAGGVKKKAADLLGITFRSIRYRLKKLGVDLPEEDDAQFED
jgi:two-component system response regulator PilR (NtrC family)